MDWAPECALRHRLFPAPTQPDIPISRTAPLNPQGPVATTGGPANGSASYSNGLPVAQPTGPLPGAIPSPVPHN